MTFAYYIPYHGEDIEDARPLKGFASSCADVVTQKAAEDFFYNCDGWESSWPLEFVIIIVETQEVYGRFMVELDYDPTFYAREIKDD